MIYKDMKTNTCFLRKNSDGAKTKYIQTKYIYIYYKNPSKY